MSILDIIKSMNTAEEGDNLFITAAAINLYNESHRRLRGQVLFTPADVSALFIMLEHLLADSKSPEAQTYVPKMRQRRLSPEEEQRLLKTIEETVGEQNGNLATGSVGGKQSSN